VFLAARARPCRRSDRHATEAGAFAEAGELIARHWRPIFNLSHRGTVAGWIDALPREVTLGDPRLCLARGWTSLFLGAGDEVEPWLVAAESHPLPGPLFDGAASVGQSAALLRSARAYFGGDVGRAIEEGRRALALDPDDPPPGRWRRPARLPACPAGTQTACGASPGA
jgi:ATP/maltotriose-dependent transcriptional regulator MalT